jgi:hypothetical protein
VMIAHGDIVRTGEDWSALPDPDGPSRQVGLRADGLGEF